MIAKENVVSTLKQYDDPKIPVKSVGMRLICNIKMHKGYVQATCDPLRAPEHINPETRKMLGM